jgi:p-aminobenzoyl-glutamate transporter AbgT
MFTAILFMACIGVLAVIAFIIWWIGLSIDRGKKIDELQIRLSMKLDRMDHFSRELEAMHDAIRELELKNNVKAKPRKR